MDLGCAVHQSFAGNDKCQTLSGDDLLIYLNF